MVSIDFYRQTDRMSCGPTALYNALQWSEHIEPYMFTRSQQSHISITRKHIPNIHAWRFLMNSQSRGVGTHPDDFQKCCCALFETYITKCSYTLENHLDAGRGAIILHYYHYVFVYMACGAYHTINGRRLMYETFDDLYYDLLVDRSVPSRFCSGGNYNYPKIWLLEKRSSDESE